MNPHQFRSAIWMVLRVISRRSNIQKSTWMVSDLPRPYHKYLHSSFSQTRNIGNNANITMQDEPPQIPPTPRNIFVAINYKWKNYYTKNMCLIQSRRLYLA